MKPTWLAVAEEQIGTAEIPGPKSNSKIMAWAAKVVSLGALTGAQAGSPADRPVGGRAAATGLQLCTRSLWHHKPPRRHHHLHLGTASTSTQASSPPR